jgi:hypothetical protein
MKASDIKEALRQNPFRQFLLQMDNGRALPVKHRDTMLFNESQTTVLVVDGDHYQILDLDHISGLRYQGFPSDEQLAS